MIQSKFNFDQLPTIIPYWKHALFSEIQPHVVIAFKKFHRDNPHVYPLFKKFSYEARTSGRKHFGIAFICERIRWYIEIETKGDSFKVNNNHKSCYARLLMIEDPAFIFFFQRRSSRASHG